MTLLLALACAGPDDGGSGGVFTTDAGLYTVTLSVDPDPPATGTAVLHVAAEGAETLGADAAMPAMDHAVGAPPEVAAVADGAWDVTLDLTMSGTWEVALAFDGAAGPDTLAWSVEVR